MMGNFKMKADKFEWIGGAADDSQDLCLHGYVTVQFGDTFWKILALSAQRLCIC